MAFRTNVKIVYTNIVICDDCKKKTVMDKCGYAFNFNHNMNGALAKGYTFKQEGKEFKNYCRDCKKSRN